MSPFIANTDRRWFDFLSSRAENGGVDEVNFWLPKATRPMKRMELGEPVFFRLKRPNYAIAGYGYFAHFEVVSVEQAWDLFGWRNGDDSYAGFLNRLGRYRQDDLSVAANRRKPLGCTILRGARFWQEAHWVPWGDAMGWAPNIVQGKTEKDAARRAVLLGLLQNDMSLRPDEFDPDFRVVEADTRDWQTVERPLRQGQGTFRLRLLSAYGRCAITGERTQPVLDAAHIQPYLGPASNHIQNGLLLTKEFHTLFDKGYVTVTPDYQVRVSSALRDEWSNGKRYYAYDRAPLRVTPEVARLRPSRDALAWHGEHRFLG